MCVCLSSGCAWCAFMTFALFRHLQCCSEREATHDDICDPILGKTQTSPPQSFRIKMLVRIFIMMRISVVLVYIHTKVCGIALRHCGLIVTQFVFLTHRSLAGNKRPSTSASACPSRSVATIGCRCRRRPRTVRRWPSVGCLAASVLTSWYVFYGC